MKNLVSAIRKRIGRISFRQIGLTMLGLKIIVIGYFLSLLWVEYQTGTLVIESTFFLFMLAGFAAQVVDGALGMAYGVCCTTLLINFGLPPVAASASVHTAEIFTTGVSGLSHIKFKNIDKKLFFRIVFTGVLGAALGAYLLSDYFDGNVIKPYVAGYLLLLGVYILYKGIRNKAGLNKEVRKASLLAFAGGLMDAVGGGGWGPIVTSNLVSQGKAPREVIGTVNTAEFFVTFFATAVFIFFLGVKYWEIVLGLIAGGMIAAPLGALLVSKINRQVLAMLVGGLIIVISAYTIYQALI